MKKAVLFLSLIFCIPVFSETYQIQKGSILFTAHAQPGLLKIKGNGVEPQGEIILTGDQEARGNISADLSEFRTGLSLRDKHLKEKYLEVHRYPRADLRLTGLDPSEKTFKGILDLHGVQKPVQGAFTREADRIQSRMTIKASDFGIAQPQFMGVSVADEIEIEVELYLGKAN